MDQEQQQKPQLSYVSMPASTANGPCTYSFDVGNASPPHSATCNRIYEYLYLGGYRAAENVEWLRHVGVTLVVNVRKIPVTNAVTDGTIEYLNIEVDDDDYEPIHWYYDEAISKIEEHRKKNGKILINCEMGISRSATICIMYIVRCKNRTLRQAYFDVDALRPCIYPRYYFWRSMIKFERQWRRKTSVYLRNFGSIFPGPNVYFTD